jgi:1-acyl-sn-glycerol-3-phosphate acyltransferase
MTIISRIGLRSFTTAVFNGLMNIHFSGLENIPSTGGCILATNHLSRLDTPLIFMAVDRVDLSGLVTHKYRYNPLFALFVKVSNSIWINRDIADYQAIRAALSHIKNGGILGIAPEGTRSRNGKLIQAKNGVALIAEKAGFPIIPVGIYGSEDTMYKLRHLQRPEIYCVFGKSFLLPLIDRNDRESSLNRNTDEIMCRIAVLLPEKYHGFYSGHPMIKELAEGLNQ